MFKQVPTKVCPSDILQIQSVTLSIVLQMEKVAKQKATNMKRHVLKWMFRQTRRRKSVKENILQFLHNKAAPSILSKLKNHWLFLTFFCYSWSSLVIFNQNLWGKRSSQFHVSHASMVMKDFKRHNRNII